MDDTMHRFRPKPRSQDARHPYKGNKNPSALEYAREGYATMAMADPEANYRNTIDDRDTLSTDVEYDPTVTRMPW